MLRRLPAFTYLSPASLAEACALLREYGPDARPLAGGTDLLVQMKERKTTPRYLVGLRGIPGLDGIARREDGALVVGPLATHASLVQSPLLREEPYCVLARACRVVGTPQVRNSGTIGGNLANASPSADSAPALLALGARLELQRAGGSRTVTVEDFFRGPFETVLQPGELISAVILPPHPAGAVSGYQNLPKVTMVDETLVSAAVVLVMEGDVCREARVALGAVAPTPLRAGEAEEVLRGRPLSGSLIESAALAAAAAARPRSRPEYRRRMVGVLVKRALLEAWQGGGR